MQNRKSIWQSTFYVSDYIYEQLKRDLFSSKIDNDLTFLCLFPIYADMNRKKQLTMGQQDEEIFLPSTIPNTKHDLYQLQERFHQMLYNEQALEIGLCAKRRRIYNDLFDELIRIIFLQCSERGLLLARVKNEYLQWINTYEELYSSGMAYGLREYLRKSQEKQNYQSIIQQLENDCQQLHDQVDQESIRYEKITKSITNDDDYEQNYNQRLLKNNLHILRSTNEILRHEVQNTLNHILSSTIFLGEPIDYDKEID
jgi:dynein light intermediate chain